LASSGLNAVWSHQGCGRRNLVSFTRTVLRTKSVLSTRTFYRTRTTTRAVIAGLAHRDLENVMVADSPEQVFEDGGETNSTLVESEPPDPPEPDNDTHESHALFARNLCPTCPLGAPVVPLLADRTFEHGNAFRACCTRRGTVRTTQTRLRTVVKAKRIVKTKTAFLTLPRVRFQLEMRGRCVLTRLLPLLRQQKQKIGGHLFNANLSDSSNEVRLPSMWLTLVKFSRRRARAVPDFTVLATTLTDGELSLSRSFDFITNSAR
jgi:hypothetical protein